MLDGGPARTPRPIDRQTSGQSDTTRRQSVASSHPEEGYPSQSATVKVRPKGRGAPGIWLWLVVAVAVLAIGLAGWALLSDRPSSQALAIDSDKYQAVFLVGGQYYFGRLEAIDDDYLKLRDVFYIQPSSDNTQSAEQTDTTSLADRSLSLIKLGNEVHGPEDMMIINRDQVLFFENLKPDSKVVQLIKDHKLGNK